MNQPTITRRQCNTRSYITSQTGWPTHSGYSEAPSCAELLAWKWSGQKMNLTKIAAKCYLTPMNQLKKTKFSLRSNITAQKRYGNLTKRNKVASSRKGQMPPQLFLYAS